MLTKCQFDVLLSLLQSGAVTQRFIADSIHASLGSVNKAFADLKSKGLIDSDGFVTELGKQALASYRVDNAVILAAGVGTRFAPLSFEKPKAMFEVRGETLIERLIRQLKDAGIDNIIVVVGYMKEAFFYLEDKYGVDIVINREYADRNNHSSVWAARDYIRNTYIVSSDQYYSDNLFKPYVYNTFISAVFDENETEEYVLATDKKLRVTSMVKGGCNAYRMQGPAYFSLNDSRTLLSLLEKEACSPNSAALLWDDILAEHLNQFDVVMNPIDDDAIHEFNYVTDLTAFDADFFANVDSKILDNICSTLNCTRNDIVRVAPIKAGLTNLSVLFEAKGSKYVYRHPGNGTEEIVNRKAETHALETAKKLGLDDTYINEDPSEGWKISKFIDGCVDFDYRNQAHVEKALAMIRTLHTSGEKSPWSFDFFDEALKIVDLLKKLNYPFPADFNNLLDSITRLGDEMRVDQGDPVFCHNDFYGPNFLVKGDDMRLIDWEYAAMGDYACDLGNFVAQGSGYSVEEACDVLHFYYGRNPSAEEERHCLGAVGVVGFYWYVWAMYKEAMGNPVGDWLYVWYKAAKQFGAAALRRYE